jgi:tRNA A37 threonylcarbamoyladenosine dehydratase
MTTNKIYERNTLIWGKENQNLLFTKHVVVFGLGGVGSYAAEALARAGIGQLTVIDFDDVSQSNINRQLLAIHSTIGKKKAFLMAERIKDINPEITVNIINDFSTKNLTEKILDTSVDYVVDAIDTLRSKIDLLETCVNRNIPVISSLGAGNRLDPEQLYTADISEINPRKCPFARNVVNKLKKREITKGITVVLSTEKPAVIEKQLSHVELTTESGENIEFKKFTPGSSPFVPPVAGYIMASYIVKSFILI